MIPWWAVIPLMLLGAIAWQVGCHIRDRGFEKRNGPARCIHCGKISDRESLIP